MKPAATGTIETSRWRVYKNNNIWIAEPTNSPGITFCQTWEHAMKVAIRNSQPKIRTTNAGRLTF